MLKLFQYFQIFQYETTLVDFFLLYFTKYASSNYLNILSLQMFSIVSKYLSMKQAQSQTVCLH
jgi:hypothetical protein